MLSALGFSPLRHARGGTRNGSKRDEAQVVREERARRGARGAVLLLYEVPLDALVSPSIFFI